MIERRPAWKAVGTAVGLWAAAERALAAAGGGSVARLLVFLHVNMKQGVFQNLLREALGIDVTAVGRLGDFERELEQSPDAVLTLPPVLEEHGLAVKLQGRRAESGVEPCILVGSGAPPRPESVKKLGALDFLGRKGMKAFIAQLLGSSPSVKRVTKFEDLLPLLQLEMADAILVPKRLLPALKARSELKLATTEIGTLSLPALATLSPSGNVVLESVKGLRSTLAVEMGIDTWR